MGNLSFQDVSEYLKKDNRLIIPVGTCEQHGKHLPLRTDTITAEYIAKDVANELQILVAPTFEYGINLPCDKLHSGTTSLTEDTLKKVFSELYYWWWLQGFRKFFIITAHGDFFHTKALQDSLSSYFTESSISVIELYDIDLSAILEKQEGVKHSCEGETSVMLYIAPELVKMELAVDRDIPKDIMLKYIYHELEEPLDGPGVVGFPTFATKEKGEKIYKLMKDRIKAVISRQ